MVRHQHNTKYKHNDTERKGKNILCNDMRGQGKIVSDINCRYILQVGRVRTGDDNFNIIRFIW